jgi:hypothetical protein
LLNLAQQRGLSDTALAKNRDQTSGRIQGCNAIANKLRPSDKSAWVSNNISSKTDFWIDEHFSLVSLVTKQLAHLQNKLWEKKGGSEHTMPPVVNKTADSQTTFISFI